MTAVLGVQLVAHMRVVHKVFDYADSDTPSLESLLMGPALTTVISKRKLREEKKALTDIVVE